jgi:hypothetical protein
MVQVKKIFAAGEGPPPPACGREGGAKTPFELPSMLPLLSSSGEKFFLPSR